MDLLSELFSSRVRAAVLGHMLARPQLRLSLTELHRRLGMPISSLQHECYKLERIGVLQGRRDGASRRYAVDPEFALYQPLLRLTLEAIGAEVALLGAIDGVEGLREVFLTTPVGQPAPGSHLVLIGEIALDEAAGISQRVEVALGMSAGTLPMDFFRPDLWTDHLARREPYVETLWAARHLTIWPLEADNAE